MTILDDSTFQNSTLKDSCGLDNGASWSNISNIPLISDIPENLYEFWYRIYTEHTTMTSTMKITEGSKRALLKIGAEYTVKDGKERPLEAVVKLLIEEHKRRGKAN